MSGEPPCTIEHQPAISLDCLQAPVAVIRKVLPTTTGARAAAATAEEDLIFSALNLEAGSGFFAAGNSGVGAAKRSRGGC
jgi:hypothetical protein